MEKTTKPVKVNPFNSSVNLSGAIIQRDRTIGMLYHEKGAFYFLTNSKKFMGSQPDHKPAGNKYRYSSYIGSGAMWKDLNRYGVYKIVSFPKGFKPSKELPNPYEDPSLTVQGYRVAPMAKGLIKFGCGEVKINIEDLEAFHKLFKLPNLESIMKVLNIVKSRSISVNSTLKAEVEMLIKHFPQEKRKKAR